MSPPTDDSTPGTTRCVSCGALLTGRFCAACGEEVREATRYGLGVFLGRSLGHAFATDSRLLRSFRTLFLRPGALTEAYFEGRRRPYLEPMQVFLLANLLYFVLAGVVGARSFNNSLGSHVQSSNFYHRQVAGAWVDARVAARGTTFEAYAEHFDRRVNTLAKTLILIMIPALALPLLIIERKRYFVEHVVFMAHFFAALLVLVLVWFAFAQLVGVGIRAAELTRGHPLIRIWNALFEFGLAIPCGVYLGWAYRRFYGRTGWRVIAVAVLLVMCFYQVTLLYRASLFFVTFWWT